MSFVVRFPVFTLALLLLSGGCAATTQGSGSAGTSGVPASTLQNQPESLIGLDRASLNSTLGKPRMLRHEAPVEIWQYRSQSCVLDVFLYEAPGGAEKVMHLESRNNLAEAVAMDRCMKSVLQKT